MVDRRALSEVQGIEGIEVDLRALRDPSGDRSVSLDARELSLSLIGREPLGCQGLVSERIGESQRPREDELVVDAPRFHTCAECSRAFSSARGLTQHRRHAHRAEYNEQIDVHRTKARWDKEEDYLLAKKEVELGTSCKDLNRVLQSHFPSRSFDAIKSHRRGMAYKETVLRLAAEKAATCLETSSAETSSVCSGVVRPSHSREDAPSRDGGPPVTSSTSVPVIADHRTLQPQLEAQEEPDFEAQGARPRRPLRARQRSHRPSSPDSRPPRPSSAGRDDLGDVVTPGGAVAHVVQQPRRSCSPGESPPVPPAREVPAQSSREEVREELRKLLSRAAPRVFQGSRLWDLARRALLGVDVFRHLDDYLRDVFVVPAPPRQGQRNRRRQPAHESRRKKKKREYAATQERFAKRQADCARAILDGPCTSTITDSRGLLLEWRTFLTGAPAAPPPDPVAVPAQRIDVFQPATAQDIKVALPPKNSAAGPDGFTARLLRSVPLPLLRVLVNLLLLLRRLPTAWRAARTSFIPKKNPASLPSDFRPITVGPVIQRLFHKILARRVTAAASLDFRQRAFQPVDGCAENILLLSTALDEARQKLRPLHLASVDLAKAFDRVTTESILRGALRAGFDDSLLAYIRELYATSYTTLQYEGEELVVQPTTGVRQGDPLSPVLFNLVVDEFLSNVDPGVAFRSGQFSLDAMAFADDLVVCASTPQGLQQRLNDLAAFLTPRGLTINTAKSFTLSLQPSGKEKKCKIVTTRSFNIDGEALPVSGVASVWRYLGISFTPDGTESSGVELELDRLLERVRRAPLKPQQRLLVLRTYLLPRLFHRLVLGPWSAGLLKRLDTKVRSSLRTWLALPHDVPLGYFHAPVGEGGLGVVSLRASIPSMRLRRLDNLRFSDHPGCAVALECPLLVGFRRRALDACHYQGIELRDKSAVHRMWAARLHGSCDGAALRDSRKVPAAHRWISDGNRLLPGRQFIDLVKLRINAQPTLERTSRGRQQDVSCRAGCRAPESLGHVLQRCHRGHRNRTKRHDNLVRYVSTRLSQLGWSVLWEPHYTLQEGVLKPDLVAYKGEESLIIDAQVVGTKMGLGFLHHQKKAKYSGVELRRLIQERRTGPVMTTTMTLNFRGVWSAESARDLLGIGLTENDLKLLSVRCLQGGMRCFWAHRQMTTTV